MSRLSIQILVLLASVIVITTAQSLDDCRNPAYLSESLFNSNALPKAFDKNRYIVVPNSASWVNAKSDCENLPGINATLVSIETEEEHKGIAQMLESYGLGYSYWTSGKYVVGNTTWKWEGVDKEISGSWIPWAAEQPTESPLPIHRVLLQQGGDRDSVAWSTVVNTQLHRYICEVIENEDPGVVVPCYDTLDLVIVLDSSGSIGTTNYEKAKCFAEKLASAFTVHEPSKLGFIVYSSTVQEIFNLTSELKPDSMSSLIQSAIYLNGGTSTDLGIYKAIDQFANRPNTVPRNMVVLTDGISSSPAATKQASLSASQNGIRSFAVGITASVHQDELLDIAGGNSTNVFTTDNFDELILLLRPLSLKVCE